MKKRGSAIVIAILLVTAIGGIAFSFGRLFLLEAANASLYENGVGAYYSAESGIEEGFLRYRYNRNAEVPFGDVATKWTLGEDKVYSSDLTDATCSGASCSGSGVARNRTLSDLSHQLYDLRMGFIGTDNKWPFMGQDIDGIGGLNSADISDPSYGTGKYSYLTIQKDQALKIDLSNFDFTSNDINFFAGYDSASTSSEKRIVEVKISYDSWGGAVKEVKAIVSADAAGTCSSPNVFNQSGAGLAACQSQIVPATSITSLNSKILNVGALIAGMKGSVVGMTTPMVGRTSLFIKPLFYNIKVGLTTNSSLPLPSPDKTNIIPGANTLITSTGYYGGVTRTLEANIDRQSGTLYDLFDYVIYRAN